MVDVGGVAGERLRSFIERIERLEDEKQALAADIREVYSEAKGAGCAKWIMTTARKWKPSWTFTNAPWRVKANPERVETFATTHLRLKTKS